MNLRHRVFQVNVLLIFLLLPGLLCAGEELPRGEIIRKVACLHNASQSYALYLPSGYTSEKKWPVLYAMDPAARGQLPVERFKEAAEKYGFILAGSNNSRNGQPGIVQDAMNAVITDTRNRFSTDQRRTYLAGLSGGARATIQVGIALKGAVAGVILCGAGFPMNAPPNQPVPFSLYLTAGMDDFNFPELRGLDQRLGELHVSHEFEIFAGGHDWPPVSVCVHAIEWLELDAMRSGIRSRDAALVNRIYAQRAAQLEQNATGQIPLEALACAMRTFSGLREISGLELQAKRLGLDAGLQEAHTQEKKIEANQKSLEGVLTTLLSNIVSGKDRNNAMERLEAAFKRLRDDAGPKRDELSRVAATRILNFYWMVLNDQVTYALNSRDYQAAALHLDIMTLVRPENVNVYYNLSCAQSLAGRKKDAIGSLRKAVSKGYRDLQLLANDHDLDPLRDMGEFQEIVDSLKKQ